MTSLNLRVFSLPNAIIDAITAATETLEQAAMKLGEVIYGDQEDPNTGDAAAADEAVSDEEANDDIVDADFEEVDEEKK